MAPVNCELETTLGELSGSRPISHSFFPNHIQKVTVSIIFLMLKDGDAGHAFPSQLQGKRSDR